MPKKPNCFSKVGEANASVAVIRLSSSSQAENRAEKLYRELSGMFVLAVPLITGGDLGIGRSQGSPGVPMQVSVCWWFDQRRL